MHVDDVAVSQTEASDVDFADEDDAPSTLDTAVAVVESVDRGVELIVGPDAL